MADDMGFSDLGCYGSGIRTPNLDRLAEEGLQFRQFYNAGRCCPTRASLLTGQYQHRVGIGWMTSDEQKPGYRGFLANPSISLAELLQQAGYRTYLSGKWHLGDTLPSTPNRRGFDQFFGSLSGVGGYFHPVRGDSMQRNQNTLNQYPEGYYATDAVNDTALSFLKRHRQNHAEQPFFLYLAHFAPHWPIQAPKESIAPYKGQYLGGWDSLRRARYQGLKNAGLLPTMDSLPPKDPAVPDWQDHPKKERWARKMATHAAMITRMDSGIGRILSRLEQYGWQENTLVLFLSDNGASSENCENFFPQLNDTTAPIGSEATYSAIAKPWAHASNSPLRKYKAYLHEGGIATPLLARWPQGIENPGRQVEQVAHITDLMPTFAEMAGQAYPEVFRGDSLPPIQGASLLPLFKGQERQQPVYYWEHEGHQAIRRGPFKLIRTNGLDYWANYQPDMQAPDWKLYNISKDRAEQNNLAKQYPRKVDSMASDYRRWMQQNHVLPHKARLENRKEVFGKYGW